jgi:hypothetical protein
MLLVQLEINSTRDWKFAKLDSPRRLVQFWQNFQTSLVLLIPNCTRHRMITYTNFDILTNYFPSRTKHLIVDVIRVQAGDTLTEILETPATEEQVYDFIHCCNFIQQ